MNICRNKLFEAKDISKSYANRKIIDKINIYLDQNEIVCLLGVSGIGKSTLFNVLSGIQKPDHGRVILGNKDITGIPGEVSYMQQKDLLLPYKKIIDNVSLPLVIKGMNKKKAIEKVLEYFDVFGLAGTQDKYPAQLSGGMRQRAALLRTYMFSKKLALLDEPFSALDAITKSSMHAWYIDIMKKIKLTTLFITHDIDEAVLLSDRIYIMSGKPGNIVKEIKIERDREKEMSGSPGIWEGTPLFITSEKFLFYKKMIIEKLKI